MKVQRVFMGGGGARSSLWLQIYADILKRSVHLTREGESCVPGAAMTAAVAAGVHYDFAAGATAMVAIEKTIEPDPSSAAVYDKLFEKYLVLYRKLNTP